MKCAYANCEAEAIVLAKGRSSWPSEGQPEHGHPQVAMYCLPHAEAVADERSPEYIECCPNCGCMFGVN